ncbi:MAG: hypothetical protein AAGF49_02055, partial [Pseudomonadota bacterium]
KCAIGLYDTILATLPDDRGALLGRVDAAAHGLMFDAALSALDAARARLDADVGLELRRVALLRTLGRARDSDAHLSTLDPTDPRVRRERLNVDLALGRIEAARAGASSLWAGEVQTADLALAVIRTLQGAGALTQATAIAVEAQKAHPSDVRIAAQRILALLASAGVEAATRAIAALPAATAADPMLDEPRAHLAIQQDDPATADAIHRLQLTRDPVSLRALRGRLRAASCAGWASPCAQHIVDQVAAGIADSSARFEAPIVDRLRLELAVQTGDWPRARCLAERLAATAPRDLHLTGIVARAAFERGDIATAHAAVDQVLGQSPADPMAMRLDEAIHLVRGDVPRYLASRTAALSSRNSLAFSAHARLANELFMIDEDERARKVLTTCRDFVEGSARAQLDYDLRVAGLTAPPARGEKKGNAAHDSRDPPNGRACPPTVQSAVGEAELSRHFQFDDGGAPTGPALREQVLLAFHLSRTAGCDFETFRRLTFRATEANIALARRPVLTGRVDGMIEPLDLEAVRAELERGEPLIFVSSHCGPRILSVLDRAVPGIFYLLQRHRPHDTSLVRGTIAGIDDRFEQSAAEIARNLRRGRSLYCVPDVPSGLNRRGRAVTAASATLFGVSVRIPDTVPKLCDGLGVPSVWIQPVWRDGRIGIEVERLPEPLPDEARDAWSDRWATAYLARVERVMSSDPRNIDLGAPLWRYLLLKGAGGRSHANGATEDLDGTT